LTLEIHFNAAKPELEKRCKANSQLLIMSEVDIKLYNLSDTIVSLKKLANVLKSNIFSLCAHSKRT